MFSKRFLRTTLGFLSLGAGLLSSCGDSGDYAILVHVNGSPTDTVSLYATAKLGRHFGDAGNGHHHPASTRSESVCPQTRAEF